MAFMAPHAITDEVYDPKTGELLGEGHLAYVHPASARAISLVVNADPMSSDGRSQWMWVRLASGDLILGMFPQGDTYLECEGDAAYPHDGVCRTYGGPSSPYPRQEGEEGPIVDLEVA